jgi:hypothetical protein
MERILLAARLQLRMLLIGVEDRRIVRVFRRWLRRIVVLPSPWCGMVVRRLRLLRRMTMFRTSEVGKCCFEFDFEVWVFLSEGVYCIPNSLTLFFSLFFGCAGDWREHFLTEMGVLSHGTDLGLPRFVHDALSRTFG